MREPEIIYEDESVLVLNKPAGLAVHQDNFNREPALTDWLVGKYPNIADVGEDKTRPGLVHRLDKDTSGVMVVAKTGEAFVNLKNQFKTRSVRKFYLALLVGELKSEIGAEKVIDWPIGRSARDPRVRVASRKAFGQLRPAETRFTIRAKADGYTLVAAELITGRTHQLRAHFKAYQHPIACDSLYGTGNKCPAGLARQALHAWRLALTLPSGEKREFEATISADFKQALDKLGIAC
ncbi:MAG: RluA family pseudouridine synthase [Candidatus Vogelbacteria bacterium CG10_big_fil_rev_8_21_14_0_10_50_13]|uniref:RluA family pseudouridine synthase n=1 Tax=Candidatus Vogelbacteria bacterium CG10_big_fil_rev_8_21_14_0_10_50_13 TaxID=1975044 RepID=A0A2H0RG29_9BACT|nr:MAG: RluA family pseudouridine synthase [Candidatus Vogelbacteria bacterium CG10_big_fil_rev_8_21_14_0_10_50_13]